MDKHKSILMSGYYGFDNSGDDAILKAIVKDFKELDKNLKITVLSNNPTKTEEMYPVQAVNRFKLGEVIKAVKDASVFISGGGSLLQDVTSSRSLWYYLMVMTIARIYRKPVVVYANGVGPINKKFNRFLARIVLNRVNLITLRDENSKEYIERMGVKHKEVYVTADPVFTLEPSPKDEVERILIRENIPIGTKLIGISIREWKEAVNLEDNIVKLISYIIHNYHVGVMLIPMHYPEDLRISENVRKKVNNSDCYVLKEKYSVEEIMGVIKELDIMVAMRLHSLIYAATQVVPMVGLVYDPKVEGILQSLGMEYMINVEDFNLEKLIRDMDYVWNNREAVRENLRLYDEAFKEKALKNILLAYEKIK